MGSQERSSQETETLPVMSTNNIVTTLPGCRVTNTHINELRRASQRDGNPVSPEHKDSVACTATTLRLFGKLRGTLVRGERTRT
jgi:hypothetical protein